VPHLIEHFLIVKTLSVCACENGFRLMWSSGDGHPGQRGQFELGGPVADRRGRAAQRGRRSARGAQPHVRGLGFVQRQGREVQGRPQVRAGSGGAAGAVEELAGVFCG